MTEEIKAQIKFLKEQICRHEVWLNAGRYDRMRPMYHEIVGILEEKVGGLEKELAEYETKTI